MGVALDFEILPVKNHVSVKLSTASYVLYYLYMMIIDNNDMFIIVEDTTQPAFCAAMLL
jgi:hypothetical protein